MRFAASAIPFVAIGSGIPLACLLAFGVGLGGVGVWAGLAGGLAVAALSLNLRYFHLTWRLRA